MDLTDKKVLVTNIVSALGQEIANVLSAAGAQVIGAYHLSEDTPQLPQNASIAALFGFHSGDAESTTHCINNAIDAHGKLDAAVILPYALPRSAFLEQSGEAWDHGLAINAAGMHYAGQAVARQMVKQRTPGSIVYISTVASEMPFHEVSLYATTLAAINTIAQVAAIELGQHDINVNVVAPGWLRSGDDDPLTFAGAEFSSPNDENLTHIIDGVPLGRIGQTAEVGELCAFLISDRARYISGAYIPIDGAYAITKSAGNTPYPDGEPWMPYESGYDPRTSET